MAEEIDLTRTPAGDALALLRRGRADLERLDQAGAGNRVRRALVVSVTDQLEVLARRPHCPDSLAVLLHDWRDRLGSHVLVAEALADLEVHPDLADQMLRRGLDEMLDEAPARLAPPRARVTNE